MGANTTAGVIVEELRRQVELQVSAAAANDTKAAGLIAATFALVALVVPRVQLVTPCQVVAGLGTFALVIATLVLLTMSIRPRIAQFSYGPDGGDMVAFLDDDDPVEDLERAIARAYVDVRARNEAEIRSKAGALVDGIKCLVATVIGLGVMLAVGGIM